jgi:predicted dehydrogenase
MTRIGVAIVGLGAASQPHAQSLIELKDRFDVIWAASRSAERIATFAAKFPFPTTTDIEAAVADPRVVAVIVLTPPNAHLDIVEKSLRAGKHVLVEKPLEASTDNAARMVEIARQTERKLGVVLQHRFREGAQRLSTVLRVGELGEVQAASVSVPWWRPQSYYDEPGRGTLWRDGGGVLLTQAIHAFDLFRSLVGVGDVIAAQVRTTSLHRMETEDYASALVRLGNGAPGTMMATTAQFPGGAERIEIIGSAGSAQLVGGALNIELLDGRSMTVETSGGTGGGANIMDFPIDAHRALIADFGDALLNDREPAITGADALETQRMLDRILEAGRRAS